MRRGRNNAKVIDAHVGGSQGLPILERSVQDRARHHRAVGNVVRVLRLWRHVDGVDERGELRQLVRHAAVEDGDPKPRLGPLTGWRYGQLIGGGDDAQRVDGDRPHPWHGPQRTERVETACFLGRSGRKPHRHERHASDAALIVDGDLAAKDADPRGPLLEDRVVFSEGDLTSSIYGGVQYRLPGDQFAAGYVGAGAQHLLDRWELDHLELPQPVTRCARTSADVIGAE